MRLFITFLLVMYTSFVFAKERSFHFDRTLPVKITAQKLTVDDENATGSFSGMVDVIQGDFHLRSKNLVIFYEKNKNSAKDTTSRPIANGTIKKFIAKGDVILSSGNNVAKSHRMTYNVKNNHILLEDNVMISRDNSIINADRVKLNTISKKIEVLSYGKKRVRALIQVSDFQK